MTGWLSEKSGWVAFGGVTLTHLSLPRAGQVWYGGACSHVGRVGFTTSFLNLQHVINCFKRLFKTVLNLKCGFKHGFSAFATCFKHVFKTFV